VGQVPGIPTTHESPPNPLLSGHETYGEVETSEKLQETFMQITGENTGYADEPHEEDFGRKHGPSPRHDTAKVGPKSP